MKPPIIEANKLTAGYNSSVMWSNADFSINPGEFIGLLGPNGAGKTTLFKLLLGLLDPLSGHLEMFKQQPKRGNPRIGYVPQRHFTDDESRIYAMEYVRLGLYGNKWGFSLNKTARSEVKKSLLILDKVGAKDLAYRPLNELSGGELQRIYLAQALISTPDILLLDEPLANLDLKSSNQLINLISSFSKSDNIAVILIAHDINPLLGFIDRIIYIANQKVVSGKISDIVSSAGLSAVYNAPIEVLRDSKGRLAVLGVEEAIHHGE